LIAAALSLSVQVAVVATILIVGAFYVITQYTLAIGSTETATDFVPMADLYLNRFFAVWIDLAILLEMVRVRPRLYTCEIDGVDHAFEGTLVAVGNCPSYGGGLRIVPAADPADGLLDVLTALPLTRRAIARLKPRLRRGTHVTDPLVRTFRAKQVRLHADGIIAYADGERIGPLPLEITCVPGALRLLR